jgi:hypothetical protein
MSRVGRIRLFPLLAVLAVAGNAVAGTITVEAWIDGRSHLTLKANTAQWHHYDYSAPGRGGTTLPTVINGDDWYPVWPDVPDANNNFCDCDSDVYTGVAPPLPENDTPVTIRVIQGRDSASIVQQPDAGNDYELIVEFDDNASGGAAWYIVELQFAEPIPAISHPGVVLLVLLITGAGVLVLRRSLGAA